MFSRLGANFWRSITRALVNKNDGLGGWTGLGGWRGWLNNRLSPKRGRRKIDIAGVPFGRTELSLRQSSSKCGSLSHGHGPRG